VEEKRRRGRGSMNWGRGERRGEGRWEKYGGGCRRGGEEGR